MNYFSNDIYVRRHHYPVVTLLPRKRNHSRIIPSDPQAGFTSTLGLARFSRLRAMGATVCCILHRRLIVPESLSVLGGCRSKSL